MPLIRRVPKRGFRNIFAKEVANVNVRELNRFTEDTIVTPDLLRASGLISKSDDCVKVLGDGKLERKLVVQAHKFSAGAKAKIEAAGGRVEVLAS